MDILKIQVEIFNVKNVILDVILALELQIIAEDVQTVLIDWVPQFVLVQAQSMKNTETQFANLANYPVVDVWAKLIA